MSRQAQVRGDHSPRTTPAEGTQGIVYLLHLSQPLAHARHYIGWTTDLERRLSQHRRGLSGARFMEVVKEQGIGFTVARTWPGTRRTERAKKGHATEYCPLCRAEVAN